MPKVIYNVSKNIQDSVDAIQIAYLGGNDDSVRKFRKAGLDVVCLGTTFPDIHHINRLHRCLSEFEPDIIHTHMGAASLLGRSIGQLHDSVIVSTMHNIYSERAPVAKFMDHPTSFLADGIVSVSSAVQNSLPPTFGAGTSPTVIHNCIDIERVVKQGENTGPDLEWASDIPEGPLIVCVARMSKKKGQHHLIRAFNSVLNEYPDSQLALTGWGDHKMNLVQLSEQLEIEDNVHFLGKVPNPYTVYNASDIVAFPSKFEGFSIGMLEAMAFGKPIVATGIEPFREALGKNHEFVTPERPNELADLIVKYLLNKILAQKRGNEARERVVSNFSGTVGAEKHYQFYKYLLDQST